MSLLLLPWREVVFLSLSLSLSLYLSLFLFIYVAGLYCFLVFSLVFHLCVVHFLSVSLIYTRRATPVRGLDCPSSTPDDISRWSISGGRGDTSAKIRSSSNTI